MVTRRFAPWRLYTSAELYESKTGLCSLIRERILKILGIGTGGNILSAVCSENKGADQFRSYCFCIGKYPVFSRCGSFSI